MKQANEIISWCNGSTEASEAFSPGSNPGEIIIFSFPFHHQTLLQHYPVSFFIFIFSLILFFTFVFTFVFICIFIIISLSFHHMPQDTSHLKPIQFNLVE